MLLYVAIAFVSGLLLTAALYVWFTRRGARTLANFKNAHSSSFSSSFSSSSSTPKRIVVVGLFHPYCNAGGGGERVLWATIRALQNRYAFVTCVVYTGDVDAPSDVVVDRAEKRFNIKIPDPDRIHFEYLHKRKWVEARTWPYFTLIGQSLGSILLGVEALWRLFPDVYIDTMGYAFTLPLFKWIAGCRVGCYVHYPTISTDMLEKVKSRRDDFNNPSIVSRSRLLTWCKLIYYRLFARIYGFVGSRANVVLVNSTWTKNHVDSLWKIPHRIFIVYPPCNTKDFATHGLVADDNNSHRTIISIAQFRPEKNHRLQIEAFQRFARSLPSGKQGSVKLLLVGSCRNKEDADRVDDLRQFADELGVAADVQFKLNVPFSELKSLLVKATIGLHTMRDEHFGIGIVECMAAGAVVLAHDSGGPKSDIVVDWHGKTTGCLASTVDGYAGMMKMILLDWDGKERLRVREAARASVITRFSDESFDTSFIRRTERLFAW